MRPDATDDPDVPERSLGMRVSFIRTVVGTLLALCITPVVIVFALLTWAGCHVSLDDPKAYARDAMVPISGPTPMKLLRAEGYEDGRFKVSTYFFFEIAPLGSGQAEAVAEIERRLVANRRMPSTRASEDRSAYQRKDYAWTGTAADSLPSWWPNGHDATAISYEASAVVTLYVLPDGRTFGRGFIPD